MAVVSVIIPSYNCREYVRLAIDSALAQTFRDFDIIVVDDGSIDGSADVLKPYLRLPNFHYIYQENRGLPAARNAGVRKSEAEYVAFVDADDEIAPNALDTMVSALNRAGASWCITDLMKMTVDSRSIRRTGIPDGDPLQGILRSDFPCRAFMFRRSDLIAVGMYDETMNVREDWELHIRMLEARKQFVYVNEPLYWYRWREGSITIARKGDMLRYTEKILRRHHRRFAEAHGREFRRIYAEQLWDLGRDYFYVTHDYGRAVLCLVKSIAFQPSLGRIFHPLVHRFRKVFFRKLAVNDQA